MKIKDYIKNQIENRIIIYDERKRLKEKKEIEKELENRCNIYKISEKKYNMMHHILKPLKAYRVEKDKIYYVEGKKHQERIFFKCIQSGDLIVHYNCFNNEDVFSFGGTAKLVPEEKLTKGFGE